MENRKTKRTRIQIDELLNKILKLEVEGKTIKEACAILEMPERTYSFYKHRLERRIASQQTAKSREDILMHKEVCRERLTKALKGEQGIAEGEKIPPRVRMDAWYRYAEISTATFKLEAETANWLAAYKELNLKEPIPLAELEEEETVDLEDGQQPSDSEALVPDDVIEPDEDDL